MEPTQSHRTDTASSEAPVLPTAAVERIEIGFISHDGNNALVWAKIDGGGSLKTHVPLTDFGGLQPEPGQRFELLMAKSDSSIQNIIPLPPLAPDSKMLREFEQLSTEFYDTLRHVTLNVAE